MSSRARRIRPDMAPRPRRALFWQVYPTLLVSLVLVAVLGAVLVHLLGGGPPPAMAVGRPGRRLHFHMFGMLLSVADAYEKPRFALTGHDIMQAGVPEGPQIGKILTQIEDWWIDNDFPDTGITEQLKALTAPQ